MTTPRPGRFARLAGWSQRHHWWALALWLVALVVVTGASVTVGDDYRDDHSLPGSESQAVADALADQDPTQSADTIQIVVQADDLTGQSVRPRVAAMLDEVADLSPVEQVSSPYDSPGAMSDDTTTGFATVTLDTKTADTDPADVRTIIDTARDADGDGLQVELGGDSVRAAEESGGAAEGIGMLAALVILAPLFGSILAGMLPIITAVFAVGTAVGAIALASNVATIPSYA
ncbi:MAG TPA: MMPL family transporter, partial [Nocardioidaceae bacterium]|nr:MMPL family transporter [Nocardioidaceae bacterium]